MSARSLALLLICLHLISGCSTNPVTGESQFSTVSRAQEIQMGETNYAPYQQQQGGQYQVDATLTPYVAAIGQKLVKVSDDPDLPYEFVVLNNDVPNAWALPGGKIAINRGLLVELQDEAQLAAVLGHEIVHSAARHGAIQMSQQQLLGIGVAVAGVVAAGSEYGSAVASGAAVGAGAWQAKYGRGQELESDHYGMRYMVKAGYDPIAAVELQEVFLALSAGQKKANWLQGLFSSHPPSQERVAKNKQTAAELKKNVMAAGQPAPTLRNKEAFQQAIKQIQKDAPAYQANNKAMVALQNKDVDGAITHAKQALKLQPNEAMFNATLGRAYLQKKQFKQAEQAFQKATTLNPNYYLNPLGLGVAQYQLKKFQSANSNLKTSRKLLPTLPGTYYLGETSLSLGNKSAAKNYFASIANVNNELGKAAQQRLQEMQGSTVIQPKPNEVPNKQAPSKQVPNKKPPQ